MKSRLFRFLRAPLLLLVLSFAPAVAPLAAPDNPDAAVRVPAGPLVIMVDFESTTLAAGQPQALSQALWARLNQTGDLKMPARDPVRAWLIRNDLFPFTPYREAAAPADITHAIKADYLITGHIDQIDKLFALDLNVYSRKAARDIMQEARLCRTGLAGMLEFMDGLALQIHEAIAADARLTAAPPVRPPAQERGDAEMKKAGDAEEKPLVAQVQKSGKKSKKSSAVGKTAPVQKNQSQLRTGPTQKTPPGIPTPTPTANVDSKPKLTPMPTPAPTAPPTPPPVSEQKTSDQNTATTPTRSVAAKATAPPSAAGGAEDFEKIKQAVGREYRAKKYRQCVTECDRALKLKPDDSMILTLKGSALFQDNRVDEARRAFQTAVTKDPANHWARYNLAMTLGEQKSPQAAQAWREYIDRAQKDPAQKDLVLQARKNLLALEKPSTK